MIGSVGNGRWVELSNSLMERMVQVVLRLVQPICILEPLVGNA